LAYNTGMLCCAQCVTSPTLQAKFSGQTSISDCSLCGGGNRACLPASAFTAECSRLIGRYGRGSYNGTFGHPDGDEPIVSLAERIAEDELLVLSPALSVEKRNEFLDAVRGDGDRGYTAASRWKGAHFGAGNLLDPDDFWWVGFQNFVQRHRRYALRFGENGIPDFPAVFATMNPAYCETIPEGSCFYRARIHDLHSDGRAMTSGEIGAPPSHLAKGARANATGIPVLYAADSEKTSISEIRPHIGSMVAVGRCVTNQEIRVFDLSTRRRVRGLDPFAEDFNLHLNNVKILSVLDEEFARPLSLHVPEQEYAPTQIVAELIASAGYDGIKYGSAMDKTGKNYAFFSPRQFRVDYLHSVAIESVKYEYVQRNPDPFERLAELSSSGE
jgi:hypothetical protein